MSSKTRVWYFQEILPTHLQDIVSTLTVKTVTAAAGYGLGKTTAIFTRKKWKKEV
jgi:hypothetical protein